jgi:hypothetical protein
MWLCGGKYLLSIFDYSVRITCPFSLATSAVLLGIAFGDPKNHKQAQTIAQVMHLTEGDIFFSHTRKNCLRHKHIHFKHWMLGDKLHQVHDIYKCTII